MNKSEQIKKKKRGIIFHKVFFVFIMSTLLIAVMGIYPKLGVAEGVVYFELLEAFIFGIGGLLIFPFYYYTLHKINQEELDKLYGETPKGSE